MMSTNNNSNSLNQFFGNNFMQFGDSQHVAEEKLDQFADGVPNHSLVTAQQYLYEQRQQQQQQQMQRQIALQQQQQLQQQQMEQHLQQQQQQQQNHFNMLNLNNNQGLMPLEASQQTSQNLQGLMNSSKFIFSFSNNPFEPSPIVEKPTTNGSVYSNNHPINVLSSTPSTLATVSDPSKSDADYAPSGINRSKRLLPLDFEPSDKNIICGNKRKYFESKGNIRFRSVCKLFTNDYHSAPTKVEKSAVVSQVMAILREDCPDGGTSLFATPQGGRWYAVSERTSREKLKFAEPQKTTLRFGGTSARFNSGRCQCRHE